MNPDIQDNITKIIKNQSCKKVIQSKLTKKALKTGKQSNQANRIPIDSMMFQVIGENTLTDFFNNFPCVYESPVPQSPQQSKKRIQIPKTGSFIRTIKLQFDMKSFQLVISKYQYLGGRNSIVLATGTKVNWNEQIIQQIIRKNSTVKGGQILLDAYINDKQVKEEFEMPKVQFASIKLLQKMLCPQNRRQQRLQIKKINSIQVQGLNKGVNKEQSTIKNIVEQQNRANIIIEQDNRIIIGEQDKAINCGQQNKQEKINQQC